MLTEQLDAMRSDPGLLVELPASCVEGLLVAPDPSLGELPAPWDVAALQPEHPAIAIDDDDPDAGPEVLARRHHGRKLASTFDGPDASRAAERGRGMVGGPKWVRQVLAGVTVEELQRFDAALDVAKTAFERRPGADDELWRDAAQHDIENAERWRAAFKLEAAWSALKSGHREMARSFDASELVSEARIVRNEADDKLTGWRLKSVADLLPAELLDNVGLASGGMTVERTVRTGDTPTARRPPSPVDQLASDTTENAEGAGAKAAMPRRAGGRSLVEDLRARLVTAKWVLDTHSDNVYHKYRILRRAVIINTAWYAVFLCALVVIVAVDWVPDALLTEPPEDSPLGSWQLLLVVMTLGIVGAFFSMATELRNRDDKMGIPDLRVRYTLIGMRPVVGAAGAVVVIVVLQSALGDALALQSTAVFGVAIAAGFTERLVTRTVSSAADAIG